MEHTIEAVFIDRDGTLGGGTSVIFPSEFSAFSFTEEAIRLLKINGIKVFSFTNQPDISRGKVSQDEFYDELKRMGMDEVLICPHTDEDKCLCRKPSPGMLIKAAEEFGLNLNRCVVIGDRWTDILAGERAQTIKILVKTGSGQQALGELRHMWQDIKVDYIAENLLDAVNWILE